MEELSLASISLSIFISDDILAEIFHILAAISPPTRANPRGWLPQICFVCTRWRKLALSLHTLWASAAGAFRSRRLTKLVIRRARKAPLCFVGEATHVTHELTAHHLESVQRYLDRTMVLAHRLRFDWFAVLRNHPYLPLLRSANLTMPDLYDDLRPGMPCYPEDPPCDAPALCELTMYRSFATFIAPNLRRLRLEARACPSLARMLTFLASTPRLEQFIFNVPDFYIPDQHIPDQVPVDLPQLDHICIFWLDPEPLLKFWPLLRIPLTAEVHIKTIEFVESWAEHTSGLDTVWSAFAPQLGVATHDAAALICGPLDRSYLDLRLWSSSHSPPVTLHALGPPRAHNIAALRLTIRYEMTCEGRFPIYSIPTFTEDTSLLLTRHLDLSRIVHLDLTDAPTDVCFENTSTPAEFYSMLAGAAPRVAHLTVSYVSGEALTQLLPHAFPALAHLTVVDFPCACFPCETRYDELANMRAWRTLLRALTSRSRAGISEIALLTLAESRSKATEAVRGWSHCVPELRGDDYEDAVWDVSAPWLEWAAELVGRVEDLRSAEGPHR